MTLITGDRVVVAGRNYSVTPGQDREVTFTGQMSGGHLYVIPSDARLLIAKGVLDKRLFDVTQLLRWQYGDAATDGIPLILQQPEQQARQEQRGAAPTRRPAALGMSAMCLPKAAAAGTWRDLTAGPGGRNGFGVDRHGAQPAHARARVAAGEGGGRRRHRPHPARHQGLRGGLSQLRERSVSA
ncbi:hypothetical protein ACWDRB_48275 [Nonomuraea sp. NPDC003707]